MTRPIQTGKTYGALNTESYFSFIGFAKKVGSEETQKIDIFLDDKLIDTIKANEFIQKIDDMYDVENKAFKYNLPSEHIGKKAIISFKNHDSGKELLNSPYTLIDKDHEKFNEAKFLHSLNEPISEELRNMYKPNCIGFLATKENLEDEEFVEYINQIMNDFPEYDFKALYFDKNSIKEIKDKFKGKNLSILLISYIKDFFQNLEVYIANLQNITELKIERFLRYKSNNVAILIIIDFVSKNTTINEFNKKYKNYLQILLDNLEKIGFEKDDYGKYGYSYYEIFYKKFSEKYSVDIDFNLNCSAKNAFVYYNLKIGLKNHEFFKFCIEHYKKASMIEGI